MNDPNVREPATRGVIHRFDYHEHDGDDHYTRMDCKFKKEDSAIIYTEFLCSKEHSEPMLPLIAPPDTMIPWLRGSLTGLPVWLTLHGPDDQPVTFQRLTPFVDIYIWPK